MNIGIIGLGRMGMALALHSLEGGFDLVAYNRSPAKTQMLQDQRSKFKDQNCGRLIVSSTINELVSNLETPRVILLMVPAGDVVDDMIKQLIDAGVSSGDTIIDGGNSFYKDSIRRYNELKGKGVHFVDMGTSGGLEGARHGACLTIGGDREVYERLEPFFKAIAIENGYGYMGPAGSGHFVKVTHNGIEYGMLQAIGEGFAVLEKGPYTLDYAQIAKIWSHGSVIRGWLMELAQKGFENDPKLEGIEGVVGGGETGRWTVSTAKEEGVAVPALEAAILAREGSVKCPNFAGKVIAAIRNAFGGHEVNVRKI